MPPSPESVRPQLEKLTSTWSVTDKDAVQLLDMETNLVSLSKDVVSITGANSQLLELSGAGRSAQAAVRRQREIAAANQMVMLTQRIAKNASSLLVGDEISPEIAFLLGMDTTFRDLLNAQLKGSELPRITATSDPEARRKLGELENNFREYQFSINRILGRRSDRSSPSVPVLKFSAAVKSCSTPPARWRRLISRASPSARPTARRWPGWCCWRSPRCR